MQGFLILCQLVPESCASFKYKVCSGSLDLMFFPFCLVDSKSWLAFEKKDRMNDDTHRRRFWQGKFAEPGRISLATKFP